MTPFTIINYGTGCVSPPQPLAYRAVTPQLGITASGTTGPSLYLCDNPETIKPGNWAPTDLLWTRSFTSPSQTIRAFFWHVNALLESKQLGMFLRNGQFSDSIKIASFVGSLIKLSPDIQQIIDLTALCLEGTLPDMPIPGYTLGQEIKAGQTVVLFEEPVKTANNSNFLGAIIEITIEPFAPVPKPNYSFTLNSGCDQTSITNCVLQPPVGDGCTDPSDKPMVGHGRGSWPNANIVINCDTAHAYGKPDEWHGR